MFDNFLSVIGLFMGVLGGLFVLGATTTKANASGAMLGAAFGAATMFCFWRFTPVNGYLYTSVGISTCFFVGLLGSLEFPAPE